MKKLKIYNNITTTCDDHLLLKNYDLLYKFNLTYLLGHIIILCSFLLLNIPEMVIVNIFSVLWFSYNSYKMSNTEVEKYEMVEKRMMLEVIIHQIIVFYFIGGDAGFQFILLSCATIMFTLYKDKNGKIYYVYKSILMIVTFITLEITSYFYNPKIVLDAKIAKFGSIIVITYTFVVSAYFTLKSYTNVLESLAEFEYALLKRNNHLQDIQKQVIVGLSNLLESRDENTGEHVTRTSVYVNDLVSAMQKHEKFKDIVTNDFLNNMKMAAPMHDIGKIKIPDSILLKPGSLTKDEYEVIKKHTTYGGELINKTLDKIEDPAYTQIAYNIAMHHHEKWNGKGYPLGLEGDEIPLEARIMALVDVYDALVTKRCYKEAYTQEEAYEIIKSGMGTHFDPDIAEIFLSLLQSKNLVSSS